MSAEEKRLPLQQVGPAPGGRDVRGARHLPRLLGADAQRAMVEAVRAVVAAAPLVRPVTAWGRPMSVRMTSAGRVGWVIRRGRYAYVECHPETGAPWPPIPEPVLAVWRAVSAWPDDPDCCLVNWYGEGARMGLHRDADEGEAAFAAPVVSISLGDPARFRIGGTERGGPTDSLILGSGDVLVMGGPARLAYHGIDRVYWGEGDLLPDGGRINLTLRVVAAA
ncbi:MAG TPA: alpha-ketoglutarate-dependent dioxygenase AlkB [Thermohalobaculum sp.]|nr:alpha-ketoglutarate-dependent dioxygenase AlkB [Thermohalobaculum sp.]